MGNHPNTFMAGLTMLAGWLATSVADRLGYALSPEAKSYVVGGAVVGVLFVGRRGVKGALLGLWQGFRSVWSGARPADAEDATPPTSP